MDSSSQDHAGPPLAWSASDPSRFFALVPCAGVGERAGAGGPKQYAHIGGRSLVAHTLAALAQVARLSGTLVVLSPSDTAGVPPASAVVPMGWNARAMSRMPRP